MRSDAALLDEVFSDETINTIVIATRHDQHFDQVKRALLSGKNIFVEKPLVLTIDELDEIEQIYIDAISNEEFIPKVMVGFNRRFSPFIIKAKDLIDNLDSPKAFIIGLT